jgi:hypothetical protein
MIKEAIKHTNPQTKVTPEMIRAALHGGKYMSDDLGDVVQVVNDICIHVYAKRVCIHVCTESTRARTHIHTHTHAYMHTERERACARERERERE